MSTPSRLASSLALPLRTDVEPDDDRARRRRQVDVGLGDATDTAADHPQAHLVVDLDIEQRLLEGLDRTGVVALDDQVQLRGLLQSGIQILEADPLAAAGRQRVALARAAPVRDLAGDAVLVDDEQVVTGAGHRGETDHLDRTRRQRLLDVHAVLVDHAAHAAVGVAGHDRVADPQRAALHQHGGHRAAAAVQVRLDGDTLRVLVRVGPQVQRRVRGQHHGLEQLVDIGALPRRDVDEHGVAAVLLGDQPVLGQLLAAPSAGSRLPCQSC